MGKEFDPIQDKPDQTEIHAVKPVKKQKHIDKLFPLPGHRIFELNLATGIINEVKPEQQDAAIVPDVDIRTGRVAGITSQKRGTIKQKEGCLYVTALHAESADKHFHTMLGKKYKKRKK